MLGEFQLDITGIFPTPASPIRLSLVISFIGPQIIVFIASVGIPQIFIGCAGTGLVANRMG